MRSPAALLALLCAAACNGEQPRAGGNAAAAETAPIAAPAPADTGLIRGTPPGGLLDWVGEIEEGIGGIAERAGNDPDGARKAALDLYVGRQEYLEMYYGSAGRLSRGAPALGEAVMEAESRFHALMQLLNAEAADPAALAAAEAALLEGYQSVRSAAEVADVPPMPPGNVAADGAGAT